MNPVVAGSSVVAIVYRLGTSTSFGGVEKRERLKSTLCVAHGRRGAEHCRCKGGRWLLEQKTPKANGTPWPSVSSHNVRRSTFFHSDVARIGSLQTQTLVRLRPPSTLPNRLQTALHCTALHRTTPRHLMHILYIQIQTHVCLGICLVFLSVMPSI